MGKSQSREEAIHEAYVVHEGPAVYDLGTLRASENENFVLQTAPVIQPQTVLRRRSRSLYSLQSNESMASSKWKGGFAQKDLLERKVSYLGRFQTQAMTETALGNLRTVIRQSKLKKTKIKMSPLGITFGTKTGGVLTSDKVAYRFLDIDDVELLRPDVLNKDVLLCVSRISSNISIQNGNSDIIYTQNYEINAFYVDPRDGVRFQHAFDNFKRTAPVVEAVNGREPVMRTHSTGTALQDVVDSSAGWTSAVPDPRGWVMSTRSERDIRSGTLDNYRHHSRNNYVSDNTVNRRINSFNSYEGNQPSPSYVYDGALTKERKNKHRNAATTADMPGSSGPVSPSGVHSLTTKVYFDNDQGAAMADVECQVKPKNSSKKITQGDTSRSSVETSSRQQNSRSSSQSSSRHEPRSKTRKDSVKRRIKDLSKEMEKLKSIMDSSDDETQTLRAQIDNTSSASSDSAVRANGTLKKAGDADVNRHAGTIDTKAGTIDVVVDNNISTSATKHRHHSKSSEVRRTANSRMDTHAGTIDTRAGAVDVVVGNIPLNASKERHHSESSDIKRSNHSGQRLISQSSNVKYATNTRTRTQQRAARENGSASGQQGRVVYYRPVTPEPVLTRIIENPGIAHTRSRSTEPPRVGGRMNQANWVYN